MFRASTKFVLFLCLYFGVVSDVSAQRRVALIIGNSAYTNVAKLLNPGRDAAAVEAMLKAARFDVVQRHNDLDLVRMRRALRDFSDQVLDADIALFFYAGHGIEVNGANYLLPVDAVLERDVDVEDEAISLERVGQILDPVKRLRLVILDACRDNPFISSMKRTMSGRSIGRGLAKVEVLTTDTLIAYAAKAGATAADGEGTNSPYTTALIKHLTTPGLDVRLALGRVRDEVFKNTARRQEPFLYGSLGGDEIALVPRVETRQSIAIENPLANTNTKDGWQTNQTRDFSFTFEMPGAPRHLAVARKTRDKGTPFTADRYVLDLGPRAFTVETVVYPSDVDTSNPQINLQNALNAEAKENEGGTWRRISWLKFQGRDAYDAVGNRKKFEIRHRSMLIDQRIIILSYSGPPDSAASPDVDRFMLSLRLSQR